MAYYQLVDNDGLCLGIDGANTAAGARARAWSCNGNPDQYWVAIDLFTYGQFSLQNLNSHLALGLSGAGTSNGTHVIQYGYRNNDQVWL